MRICFRESDSEISQICNQKATSSILGVDTMKTISYILYKNYINLMSTLCKQEIKNWSCDIYNV